MNITLEEIEKACQQVRHIVDKQAQFREDPKGARQEDFEKGRGVLIINPEILPDDLDPHGQVIDRDGVEYRVYVDPYLAGMRNSETGEVVSGYWLPPAMTLADLTKKIINAPCPHGRHGGVMCPHCGGY
jgi:hypothetical protein